MCEKHQKYIHPFTAPQCLVVAAVADWIILSRELQIIQSKLKRLKIKEGDLHTHPAMLFSLFYFISPASDDLDYPSSVLYVLN